MTSIIENSFDSTTTFQVTNGEELEDYLIYVNYRESKSDPEADTIVSQTTLVAPVKEKLTEDVSIATESIFIPKRSPKRLLNGMKGMLNNLKKASLTDAAQISDASSFDERSIDSDRTFEESIFSDDDYRVRKENEMKLDEFGLNLEGIGDIDAFLDEFEINEDGESNMIFQIDDIVTIVGIHSNLEFISNQKLTYVSL